MSSTHVAAPEDQHWLACLPGEARFPWRASVGRRATDDLRKEVEQHRGKLESYETLCRDIGELPADVALGWLLHQKAVTSPIIGPRTLEQLDASMHALQITLSPDIMKRLDTIFPGPGGPAPEAYAW